MSPPGWVQEEPQRAGPVSTGPAAACHTGTTRTELQVWLVITSHHIALHPSLRRHSTVSMSLHRLHVSTPSPCIYTVSTPLFAPDPTPGPEAVLPLHPSHNTLNMCTIKYNVCILFLFT
ncbi:unnamed protein product [Arctogadus glacialis]